jgi:hypothetical protein
VNTDTWIDRLGRIGRLAQGLVFVSVGTLSAIAASRHNGGATDSRGAMHAIVQQPFGRVMLLALIGGLICYVVWRALAAFIDVERRGSDAKGLVLRGRSLFVAILYGGLTAAAVKTLLGTSASGGGGDRSARDWTARALETPFGACIVVLAGAAVVAGGIFQCVRAYRSKFERQLDVSELTNEARRWLLRVCAFGIAARGLVFCLAGLFLIQAGVRSDASKARGLSGSLDALQSQPYGRYLFGIVAIGLAAFGIYCCVRARYGRISPA